jgi:hypothetical protein
MIIGNGMSTCFWLDRWYYDCALSTYFYQLFQICTNPQIIIFTVLASKGSALQFSRQLIGVLLHDFNSICSIINQCQLQLEHDHLVWRWNFNGLFTTHSAYTWLILQRCG